MMDATTPPKPGHSMSSEPAPPAPPADPAFGRLLYRYFFFAWLFKDAGRGGLLERADAWRHNVEQSRWLPTYLRRYVVCGLLCCAAGGLAEPLAPALAMALFIPSLVAAPMAAVALLGYLWLRAGA